MTTWRTTTPDGRPFQVHEEDPSDRFFHSRSFRMFISYRSGHEAGAIALAKQVEIFGIDTFVACRDFRPGDHWEDEIERVIIASDALLAYCSADFGFGIWATREVKWAKHHRKPIFPLVIGEQPTGPVSEHHSMQLNGTAAPIAEIIRRYADFPRMTESLVTAIEKCAQHGSFDLANQLARTLSEVLHMSDNQAKRLIWAYNNRTMSNRYRTNQVRAAHGFGMRSADPRESVLTQKINELTSLSVCHDSNGDIVNAPPISSQRPDQTDSPAFTRVVFADPFGERG